MENNGFEASKQLYYMGEMSKVRLQSSEKDRDVQLIDRVEEAQLDGRLQVVARDLVDLHVSHHGIRVVANDLVIFRYPLHQVAQVRFLGGRVWW